MYLNGTAKERVVLPESELMMKLECPQSLMSRPRTSSGIQLHALRSDALGPLVTLAVLLILAACPSVSRSLVQSVRLPAFNSWQQADEDQVSASTEERHPDTVLEGLALQATKVAMPSDAEILSIGSARARK